jgi:hypothetical protein
MHEPVVALKTGAKPSCAGMHVICLVMAAQPLLHLRIAAADAASSSMQCARSYVLCAV